LIVVQPSQQALYEVLRRSLKEDSPITVIYDRRVREGAAPVAASGGRRAGSTRARS
jgi:hypothetical protein